MSGRRGSAKAIATLCAATLLLVLGSGFLGAALRDRFATHPAAPTAVDIGFAQDMIVHHQQAIAMCQLIEGRADPQIAGLAQVIQSNQLLEIGQLQGFLLAWNAPLLPTDRPMSWLNPPVGDMNMPGMSAGRTADRSGTNPVGGAMPGMATQDELNRLGAAPGGPAGLLFLQLMIRRHEGGLPMAAVAVQRAAVPPIHALAARMSFDQTQEIGQMTFLLRQRDGQTLPPP